MFANRLIFEPAIKFELNVFADSRAARRAERRNFRLCRKKFERSRVQTIALSRRRRTVRENVTEMSVTAATANLYANHSVRIIGDVANVIGVKRRVKRSPAGAGMEFCIRTEKRQTAQTTDVSAFGFVIGQISAKRRL